jgi:uncharacterized membrane protein
MSSTSAYGINASGQVVGAFDEGLNSWSGFLLSGGNYTRLPMNPLTTLGTWAYGINGSGQIVGATASSDSFGFSHPS